ncbi:glycosyl hydrolase family 61-domain-containing protein [Aspergillus californicus]
MFFLIHITSILLGMVSYVFAHGHVQNIHASGKDYKGFDTNVDPYPAPELAAWATTAKDQGYTADFSGPDFICHKGAVPGHVSVDVAAGDVVKVTWDQWPYNDHKGPVIDYLAACNGDCADVDKTKLEFFKIDEKGLVDPSTNTWASDELAANGASWDITIPADLKPGGYVLRHEIIALHSTGNPQPYMQCVNLKVSGTGTEVPKGTLGTQLYTGSEEGFKVNIWQPATNYKMVGPALYKAADDDTIRAGTGAGTSESSSAPDSTSESATTPATTTTTTATITTTTATTTVTTTMTLTTTTTLTLTDEDTQAAPTATPPPPSTTSPTPAPTTYSLTFAELKFDCTMIHDEL